MNAPAGSVRTLLSGLIDYAGLFPPAKLDMARAAEAYNRARVGEHEWMLGRFICPVSRLDELTRHASALMPGTAGTSGYREYADAGEPWRISALFDTELKDIEATLDAIDAFNARHGSEDAGQAVIDVVELKVSDVNEIDWVLDQLPEDVFPFFEFPVSADCRGFVAALAGEPAAAKIRTGGVVPGAFPTPAEVLAFINACASVDVPFKATAGLHHPVRGSYKLTYEKDCASAPMYGFLNVFLAACFVRIKGANDAEALRLLADEDPASFKFLDDVVSWQGHGLEVTQVAAARESFALAFGSCSFDEPVEDLRRMGAL
jgi:hypothetical protein